MEQSKRLDLRTSPLRFFFHRIDQEEDAYGTDKYRPEEADRESRQVELLAVLCCLHVGNDSVDSNAASVHRQDNHNSEHGHSNRS